MYIFLAVITWTINNINLELCSILLILIHNVQQKKKSEKEKLFLHWIEKRLMKQIFSSSFFYILQASKQQQKILSLEYFPSTECMRDINFQFQSSSKKNINFRVFLPSLPKGYKLCNYAQIECATSNILIKLKNKFFYVQKIYWIYVETIIGAKYCS